MPSGSIVSRRDRAISQPDRRASGILVMIGYEINVGFAVGRLVQTFYRMALRWAGAPERVHFSFVRIDGPIPSGLPSDFSNLLEFDYRRRDAVGEERLASYIRRHGIEVVFALDMAVQCPCLRVARRAGVRTVLSYWGAPMSSIMSTTMLALKRLEVRYLRPWRPDYFIFESEAMRKFGVLGRGLDVARTTVIPTGIDAERFSRRTENGSAPYERFGIPRDRSIVVYMGHLHRRKGVHVLMRAAEHWVSVLGRTDIHCLFLGNRTEEVRGFRSEYDLAAPYITFGGYQSDIPELLSGCTIGCVPSTGWDSFPMSSLEMQSCGLPVAVSDLQGVPETVVDQLTGIVTPAGDHVALARALVELIDDPIRRSEMSMMARRRVEEGYTCDRQVESLEGLLRSVAG